MFPSLAFLTLLLLGISIEFCEANRPGSTEQKIYEPVESHYACFRRMNATHTTGCSSGMSGNVGVVYKVDSDQALSVVLKDGPHAPYVVVMYTDKFTRAYLDPMRTSDRIAGIMLLRRGPGETIAKFSEESTCPNEGYGLYRNASHYCEKWNEDGTGLMQENFNFPIFLINDEKEGKKVLDCYEEHNAPVNGSFKDYPLCATQLRSHMLAAVDTVTCLRRTNMEGFPPSRICDPMGDMNVWGPLVPKTQQQPYSAGSVIIVAARMDASSLFDKLSPGADSASTGMAALLSIAQLLKPFKDVISNSSIVNNVYFMLFNGESYDYIGSSRIAYDMKLNVFPVSPASDNSSTLPATLKFENVKYFIELNQVALTDGDTTYYAHATSGSETQNFVQLLKSKTQGLNIDVQSASNTKGIPPSSFQTFKAHSGDLEGLVISNFNDKFKNRYYNSFLDNGAGIGYVYQNESTVPENTVQARIAELSAAVARAIMQASSPNGDFESIIPNFTLVDELLHCFISSSSCKLFREIADDDIPLSTPYPLYVGVHGSINPLSMYVKYLLTKFQGELFPNASGDSCSRDKQNITDLSATFSMVGQSCYLSTANWTYAISPAFELRGSKINWDNWNTKLYSTWTESIWQTFSVRIFLKPSQTHDILILTSGILVLLVSIGVTGWMSKKSDVIFPPRSEIVC